MASSTDQTLYDVGSDLNGAMERDDWAEIARILFECSRRDSDSIMTQLVSRDQWDAVKQVIRCVGDEKRTWDIAGVLVTNNILLSVAEENWRGIGEMPHKRVLHSTLEWILQQACTRAQQTDIVQYVFPHCEDDQLDSSLHQLVTHRLWFAAGRMLLRPVSDERVRWGIQQACQRAEKLVLGAYVIPFCPTSTLDFLLAELVSRDMWQAAGRVLMRGVSDTTHCRGLHEACCRAEGWQVKHFILPFCTQGHCNSVLTNLALESQWKIVDKLLNCVRNISLTVIIDGMFIKCKGLHLICSKDWIGILNVVRINTSGHEEDCNYVDSEDIWEECKVEVNQTHPRTTDVSSSNSTEEQTGRTLRQMSTLPAWWALGKVLEQGLDDSSVTQILKQTLLHDDDEMIVEHVLPYCTDSQTDLAVTELVSASQWESVTKLVQLVGDRKQTWTVGGTSVNTTLLHLVAGKRWREVGEMLQPEVDDAQFRWATDMAVLHANDTVFAKHIVSKVVDRRIHSTDIILTKLVHENMWRSVKKILQLDRKKMWRVDNMTVDRKILYLLAARRWRKVGIMLAQGINDVLRLWLTQTASSNARSTAFVGHILPHCADDQLDSVLTTLVERRQWEAVDKVLKRGVSDSVKQWAVNEACQHCEKAERYVLYNILSRCADDQLDSALTILVERRQWEAVHIALNRGVSDSVKRWAMEEAFTHLDEDDLKQDYFDDYESDNEYEGKFLVDNILPCCADDQLDSVLTTLVEQRMWRAVQEILKKGVSDSVKQWAVKEACRNVRSSYFLEDILYHCADDQLDSVLTTLVEQRLWRAVANVLAKGVSDSVKQWAVGETVKFCVEDDLERSQFYQYGTFLIYDILPHCADDQLDSVLTTLVERRLWQAVGEVLNQGVSDSVKQWAVGEAFKYCEEDDDYESYHGPFLTVKILPHCVDDLLDSVLATLAERRLWFTAGHVLERVAGDLNKAFVIHKPCEHCRSAGVYFSKCRVHDSDSLVKNSFTPQCADGNLDSATSALTNTNECTAVRNISGREVSDVQRRESIRAAFQHADEDTLIESILPYYVYDSIHSALKMLASRGFWSAFLILLHNCIIDTLYIWAMTKESKDDVFLDMVRHPCDGVTELTPAMWRSVTWSGLKRSLKQLFDWDTPLCEVLCESLLGTVKEIWLSGREKDMNKKEDTVLEEALSTVERVHQLMAPVLMKCKTYRISDLLSCTEGLQREFTEKRSKHCFLLQLYFNKSIVLQYYKRKAWTQMTDAILVVLTTVPVALDVHSVALRFMLRHKKWDVIRHACLSSVCEQDRRQLFQAAVKQRQWSAVKRWADHTLYDDQRLWALGEARQEKRWDVYLKLADHGLSEWERVGVLFRVAMHADWKLVHHMLRTVADVTDMIDLLTITPGTLAKIGTRQYGQRMNQLKSFVKTVSKDTHTLKTLKTMAKRGKWWVVLHNIRHKPNLQHARRALKVAVSSGAWHAVMQLVRLETDVTRRDSLFRDMVRLRQWAVCRELLEQGVSHELSLERISKFIEHCQWTLVAMVMECPMDDERRKKIMHQAIMMREGSVVWQCITKLQTALFVCERKDMFQLAFSREVWQAVKPLIEEKDVTGIRHRDTALLEAIEQHQWDVVDHCQRHHADINMKDDDGHTPIHRAARKGDWEAVKELTVRDGDPNLSDNEGLSVLHRAIRAKQWDAVTLLIQFHGDIHQAAQYTDQRGTRDTRTPLHMLIDNRQGEVIESSLMWCPDQQKVVNDKRETVLHAVCLSGWPGALHHLVARKVDPLAVTKRGCTALCYAVLCKDSSQRMVAECIKLGLSIYRPYITVSATAQNYIYKLKNGMLKLPLALSVMRGLPVVTQMLCEAGMYSNRQFRELNIHLVQLTKANTGNGRELRRAFSEAWKDVHNLEFNDPGYPFDTELVQKSADYLHHVSSTPRRLVSTCRLVISRCLTLSKTRHRDIAQLPLSPMMKNYLMFSDLTDPQYPDLSYRGKV